MTKDEAMKLAFEALKDMNCGWKYIRESHGDLYGVGWDRAQQKADDAIAALRQALEQPVSFYVYEWVNQSDGIVFRSFRHDEHHMGREPDRTIAFTEPDTGIDRGAWSDVPDATKWVDELRGGDETEEEEPVVLNQFLSDVMTAAGLVKHGKQSKALAARLQVEVMKLHTALRAALEQPEQEPFGYFHYDLGLELWQETGTGDGKPLYAAPPKPAQDLIVGYADSHDIARAGHDFWVSRQPGKNTVPLYLYGHPPKIWQGLTDEEEIELDEKYGDDFNAYIDARDAKLKEKNS